MTSIVVDANIAIYSVVGAPTQEINEYTNRFWNWTKSEDIDLFEPRLWWSETTSILRVYVSQKLITQADAEEAIQILNSLQFAFFK